MALGIEWLSCQHTFRHKY